MAANSVRRVLIADLGDEIIELILRFENAFDHISRNCRAIGRRPPRYEIGLNGGVDKAVSSKRAALGHKKTGRDRDDHGTPRNAVSAYFWRF